MRKEVKPYLIDVLESIEKIEKYTKGMSEENFYRDVKTQDAVLRRLEIMGEKDLPELKKNILKIIAEKL